MCASAGRKWRGGSMSPCATATGERCRLHAQRPQRLNSARTAFASLSSATHKAPRRRSRFTSRGAARSRGRRTVRSPARWRVLRSPRSTRNRIGWCVLHPPKECAGQPCTDHTPGRYHDDRRFPCADRPAPTLPRISQAMAHGDAARGTRVSLRLRGRHLRDGRPAQLDRRLLQDLRHAAVASLPGANRGRARAVRQIGHALRGAARSPQSAASENATTRA